MKKVHVLILFASIFVLGFTKTSFAQGNLQFNQVILYDIASGGIQAITVPAGKVWKIESVSQGTSGSTSVLLRNSSVIAIGYFSSTTNTPYPFWVPQGFTGSFLNGSSARCCISIIEFNVVP